MWIFLRYDMPLYGQNYSGFGWKQFLTRFWVTLYVADIAIGLPDVDFIVFILVGHIQIINSVKFTNLFNGCAAWHCLTLTGLDESKTGCERNQKPARTKMSNEKCQKLFPTKTRVILPVQWHVIPQKNPLTLLDRWLKGFSHIPTFDWDISNQS